MPSDLPYWLALLRFPKFGAVRMGKLMKRFPTMKEAFLASVDELVSAGIDSTLAHAFIEARGKIDPMKELETLERHGVKAITRRDADYPKALATIYDPPAIFFVVGTLPNADRPHLAVVGTREPSAYSREAIERILVPALPSGIVVVSGMALGVDTLAHRAAVENRTPTIAVLGSGLDKPNWYPSSNRRLAEEIIAGGGALVSEFPIGTPPFKSNFPMRNRVIAGLSRAVLIVEAKAQSGSLITAKSAVESGRDVYAIPGPVTSELSEGPHILIKMGAALIGSSDDLCQALGTVPVPKPERAAPTQPMQAKLWELLTAPTHMDELIRSTGFSTAEVGSSLTLMEMNGVIRHLGSNVYARG